MPINFERDCPRSITGPYDWVSMLGGSNPLPSLPFCCKIYECLTYRDSINLFWGRGNSLDINLGWPRIRKKDLIPSPRIFRINSKKKNS